jgi:pyridoxamine 5'-phosphate oxidase
LDLYLTQDPFESLQKLLAEASAAGEKEPTAMTLSTLSLEGGPSSRTVLFKGFLRGGLSFYTNYESRKALELARNPQASLSFFWGQQYRQVQVQGLCERTTREESEAYFKTRARLSQIGAWASQQSQVLKSHAELEERVEFYENKFRHQEVPCPPNWGGYILVPQSFEFWFGRDGRLHSRYRLVKQGSHWLGHQYYP